MNIKEILDLNRPTDDIITDLKRKTVSVPDWSELIKDYEPALHRIKTDKLTYPDKIIQDDKGRTIGIEPITRVAVGLQKLAVNRMSEFLFTTPIQISTDGDADQLNTLKKVLKKNNFDSLNKKRSKILNSQCEVATLWYTVEEPNEFYGFKTNLKIKSQVFSPENGDILYPLFDETNDMIAFSRELKVKELKNDITYFETYTAENYYRWQYKQGGYELIEIKPNLLGKIPIVYSYKKEPIWQNADNGKVHEIELLLSRNGDIIAYHASPVLILKGELIGAPKKGQANKVFITSDGTGGAEYVSWNQSPETTKFQFETLLRLYFMELQLPDLSFENIKGLGAQSGEARKWLMVDAHLKVGDEAELYEEMINRDLSIVKTFLSKMNLQKSSIQNLDTDVEIIPFIIEDQKSKIDVLVTANGGKPIISQQKSVELAGFTDDPAADYIQIEGEWDKENNQSVFNPTN